MEETISTFSKTQRKRHDYSDGTLYSPALEDYDTYVEILQLLNPGYSTGSLPVE